MHGFAMKETSRLLLKIRENYNPNLLPLRSLISVFVVRIFGEVSY